MKGFPSRSSSKYNIKMATNGTVDFNGCAVFSFLHEAKRDFLYMKCKLVAVLEEKIIGLERQVEMLLRS